MYAYTQSIFLVYFAFFLLLVFCSWKAPVSTPLQGIFFGDILGQCFVNFHNGGKCHWHPKCSKRHYEPLVSQQNSSISAWWNDNHSFFIITAIWHIKSPCQTWAGAFVIPLTPMNLKPFFTLLLSQTLFVHGEQATDFANNFLVSSSAFPAEMTSPIRHWFELFVWTITLLFEFICTIN